MDISLIVAIVFFIWFLIVSIFGFWGLILSFTILSFFMDTKEMIFVGLYASTIAQFFVVCTDPKSFSKTEFLSIFPTALIATIIGVFIFTFFSSILLLKIFAVFLMILSIKSLFFDTIKATNKYIKHILLFIGGILQGIFGTWQPFAVMAMKNSFKNKSELRTTMSAFLVIFNIIRSIQLGIQGNFEYEPILQYWWLPLILLAAVIIGHRIHVKCSEYYFKLGIDILILFCSIVLLLK